MLQPEAQYNDDLIPVSTVLERVGVELDNLALGVDDLQTMLSPLLSAAAQDSTHGMVQGQRLDAIGQTLASLATFLMGLSQTAASHHRVDAVPVAELLPLTDLADRLLGRHSLAEADDFEMF